MGSFAYLAGDCTVPLEKRDEFNAAVQQLLTAGGICDIHVHPVSHVGKNGIETNNIWLLDPAVIPKAGDIGFNYSYYEDDMWETAWYDVDEMSFTTGKKGSFQFSDVCCAIALLYEQYCPHCLAMEDGDAIDMYYLGWINHVLGTDFTGEYRLYRYPEMKKFLNDGKEPSEIQILQYLPDRGFIKDIMDVPTDQIMKISLDFQKIFRDNMDRPFSPVQYPEKEDMLFNMTLQEAEALDTDAQHRLLNSPATDIKAIIENGFESIPETEDLRWKLNAVLIDLNEYYKYIMMFKDTYEEFQKHPRNPYVRACVLYLEQMAQDLREEGACVKKLRSWSLADTDFKYNPARRKLKQFLGLLHNKPLRETYLGF